MTTSEIASRPIRVVLLVAVHAVLATTAIPSGAMLLADPRAMFLLGLKVSA